ncbi:MAG TPA: dimethylamine monooxygenase subunit DmmA family protein [Steroidobacteraceae bacterium]|jgi:DNA-directed RNA polymerase subunit RPC12/RpoP|nr:dimethylamine monooxygenase subunit DmmA family protein [Steroidobacteraceae bacterium]
MLVTGIKSKPVYAPLRADTGGRYHLMLAKGVGNVALMRVLDELRSAAPQALGRTRVLLIPGENSGETAARPEDFAALGLEEVRTFADVPGLLRDFRSILEGALMGTRLYVAGPESFIGLAMKIALEFDLNKDEVRAEELGTLARRVYCIHCRATTEEVRTNIVRCVDCGSWLLVRDHYSRRLAAYMGVMVDAEAPGELPEIKEIFI